MPRLFPFIALLLPLTAVGAGFENAGAAAVFRSFDTEVRFEDGTESERHFRRAGIEYWEGITAYVHAGFALGYSESGGRDPARPFETVSGNYGLLGFRVDAPLTDSVSLRGRAEYLLQRDRSDGDELETRSRETHVELAPVLQVQRLEFSVGATWRELDYRDILQETGAESVRHAEGTEAGGGFAAIGLRTGDGLLALRYDAGATTGWTLRFERTFE